MHAITATEFIETIFPPGELDGAKVVLCHPDSFTGTDGQPVQFFRNYAADEGRNRILRRVDRRDRDWYYCVSSVWPRPDGGIRRTKADLADAWVLVLDDIGTKAVAPPVAPSYILETSAGNHQYGYLLEPLPVGAAGAGGRYYDACLLGLARAGFNDPGCRSASRVMRLPGSLHSTGWVSVVRAWSPGRVWALEALMGEMGVEPAANLLKSTHARVMLPGGGTPLAQSCDPIYHALVAQEAVLGHGREWVYVVCPWRATHTDGAQGATSTAYSPEDYGFSGRGFKCLHGHCTGRTLTDFMTEVMRRSNTWKHA